jgi:tartrate dehydrogenase/decarboxylase / D-malate dehydrogenase
MKSFSIAMYGGDGIGVDVARETVKVLDAVQSRCGFSLEITEFDWGHRHWKNTGKVVPDDFLETLTEFDAIYLGAVGDPENLPDHITLRPLIAMRQAFEQYACVRPAVLLPAVSTVLANKAPGEIDMVILRENSEGEYANVGGSLRRDMPEGIAVQTAVHSRKGIERILRYGFELARKRRSHLTMTTKSNAMAYSMVLWDDILEEIAPDYAGVEVDKCHVDALSMNLVRCPEKYDVIVATNLFGDILSDLGGAISGGLGLAPSANINPEREYPSLFEPVHGSAPDIAGKNIANPIAAIRSAAMMLDHLGESDAAKIIDEAVIENLRTAQVRTPDLGGTATTVEVGDDVARCVKG